MNNGFWETLEQKIIYDGYIRLYEDQVRLPDGKIIQYAVNRAGNAAAILLCVDPTHVLLTYQYRYPINQWIYDLPGGKIDNNESPEEAAIRECTEETGYKPLHLVELTSFHKAPSRYDSRLYLFFCNEATKVGEVQNSSIENVKTRIIEKSFLEKQLKNNEITDPALLIAWHSAKSKGLI